MSKIPSPHGPNNKSIHQRISVFLNSYLGKETLMDIPYPNSLEGPYEELSEEAQEKFVSFTFHFVFGEAAQSISGFLGRALKVSELGLIKRRVVLFLKESGFVLKD